MGLIGRQESTGAFLKLDDISAQFNDSTTTFNLTLGGQAFFAVNPYTLLVSLSGVIQEPISAFTIVENQINFASAPQAGADFFYYSSCYYKCHPITFSKRCKKIWSS